MYTIANSTATYVISISDVVWIYLSASYRDIYDVQTTGIIRYIVCDTGAHTLWSKYCYSVNKSPSIWNMTMFPSASLIHLHFLCSCCHRLLAYRLCWPWALSLQQLSAPSLHLLTFPQRLTPRLSFLPPYLPLLFSFLTIGNFFNDDLFTLFADDRATEFWSPSPFFRLHLRNAGLTS